MPSRPKRNGRRFRKKHRAAPARTAAQSKRGRRPKPAPPPPPLETPPAADPAAVPRPAAGLITCAHCRPDLYPYPTCSRD